MKQVQREVNQLLAYDPKRIFIRNEITSSNLGLRLVNSFHPQMWHVRCTRYRSPFETFSDDIALGRAIKKALQIWPDRYGANGSSLRRMLKSFSNTVGVSNFRPTVAMGIVDRYSPPGGRVLDFAAGYGGRLAGALVTGRSYLGIDPGRRQVSGLRKLERRCRVDGVSKDVQISCAAAEDYLPSVRSQSFDLVFSSPPYLDKERYGVESEQSYRRYPSRDEWIRNFLKPVIKQSARVLRRGGYLVLNVNDGVNGLAPIIRQFECTGMRVEAEWKMRLAMLPYKRSTPSKSYKFEPIITMRKN
jgi:SAM-dependent methyltransferase